MVSRKKSGLLLFGGALALISFGALVQGVLAQDDDEEQPIPEFTEAFLEDPANQDVGERIWQDQCRHCHGSSAYPGKAPKLRPNRYDPEFVYHRVAYGYRAMPAWGDVYSEEEIKSVVAYVLGDNFSP